MPNPTLIHPESQNVRHFVGIAELYLQLGKPKIYEVEPQVNDHYRPDIYTHAVAPTVIEYQRSRISQKRMQVKVDLFVESFRAGDHDARKLWVLSDTPYDLKIPQDFQLIQSPLYQYEKEA